MEYGCMKGSIAHIPFQIESSIDEGVYGGIGYSVHVGSSYIVPV